MESIETKKEVAHNLEEENNKLRMENDSLKTINKRLENKVGELVGSYTAMQLSFEQMTTYAQSLENQNNPE